MKITTEYEKSYRRKVWKRLFLILSAFTAIACMFPPLLKLYKVMMPAFASSYLQNAIPQYKTTRRQNACALFGFFVLIVCSFLLFEFGGQYIDLYFGKGPAPLYTVIVFIACLLLWFAITFFTGYIIAVFLSILFFGRGEIGYKGIIEYTIYGPH